ncbi:MAG: sugar phosphate isomerase/epimerase [Planctomycetota bacterium]|nr:sugar phosphate isomerase/epimerase [Planctomycetota bacterium]
MRIGICGSIEQSAQLKEFGADFVEENVQRLLLPQAEEETYAKAREAFPDPVLPVPAANCFLPGALKCVGPAVDREALLRYAEHAFMRAHDIGLEVIVFGSGGSRAIPEGFDREKAKAQFVALLKDLGPLAEGLGVHVVVEPLNRGECNFINSLADGAELVRAAGHPHIRLLADFFHMLREDEPPEAIDEFGSLLRHVHLAEKAQRTAPGVAGDDFLPYLEALKRVGYADLISIECKWNDLATEAPLSVAYLRGQLAEAGL